MKLNNLLQNRLNGINQRCANEKMRCYKYYGGKGIKNFLTRQDLMKLWFRDMAFKMKKPSIDRIDNNGNYIFENCRFIELEGQNFKSVNSTTRPRLFKSFVIASILIFQLSPHGHTEPDYEKMATAIYFTEGSYKTSYPFGVLSVTCHGYTECREVTLNSLKKSWNRYQQTAMKISFEEFFANRWCPVGAENDPKGLNQNWLKNLNYFMEKL